MHSSTLSFLGAQGFDVQFMSVNRDDDFVDYFVSARVKMCVNFTDAQ